jgi:hypothetical protein
MHSFRLLIVIQTTFLIFFATTTRARRIAAYLHHFLATLGFDRNLSPWYSHPAGLLSNPFSLNPVCPRRLSIWKGQYHILYCIGTSYEMALVIFWYGIISVDW